MSWPTTFGLNTMNGSSADTQKLPNLSWPSNPGWAISVDTVFAVDKVAGPSLPWESSGLLLSFKAITSSTWFPSVVQLSFRLRCLLLIQLKQAKTMLS